MTPNSIPLRNGEVLASLYGAGLPPLESVRLRSVHLNWRGPGVTLRLDLPAPSLPLPEDWSAAGVDTVQGQLQFLAVADLELDAWEPPVTMRLTTTSLDDGQHRIRVTATTDGDSFLRFTSSADVLVGHVSGFRLGPGGSDDGPHVFRSRIDSMRHTTVPDSCEKTFYERL
ncbi:Imm50 family immunity protein [Streptomyces sp. NPDC046939]|uniref:Imm50 family immunity protein n=1 Tax=Streptomyces sp. NPDC046939 TaxID=3155376 RepID=UPI0034074E67